MIKKTLYFGNPVHLKLRQAQLIASYLEENSERSVSVEDIGLAILDHPQITITHGLMNALIDNNAAVLWCDSHHLPNGMMLPMSTNQVFTKKLQIQLEVTEPLKKQMWKQTIQAKIRNQAMLLERLGKDAGLLYALIEKVTSGDTTNIEGQAAAWYWKKLFEFDETFRRKRFGVPPNNMLNYGYAIIRAVAARSLVASGCLPAVGIHHRNQYNAFCLADDIMEPYRIYCDVAVIDYLCEHGAIENEILQAEHKKLLLQLPACDVIIDDEKSPLMVAMQRTTASVMKCFEGETRKIQYPLLYAK
ncbi:MAG: type II CRISPR-associated endonuclease Cas1 [Bacteroidetes bacterium HGW-Bacteroidetes-21]|nr:MAG: type II CRISPR-associated endonuclease Cas1 [Bacteroidetes bacterium HGW-Bacteroidetes-21]